MAEPSDASAIHRNPFIAGKLHPLAAGSADRSVPLIGAERDGEIPVPPKHLWEGYAEKREDYLAGARKDLAMMLGILERAGRSPQTLTRVLDFGCAAARMLRFFPFTAGKSELWGVDINAEHISWCQQHLSPPLLFATTTTAPHLPFEDNYFDLVYCCSVFTHISDLADAWFLELRRILRVGGYAYVTIHDKHTVDLLLTRYKDDPLFAELVAMVRERHEGTTLRSRDYAYCALDADPVSQVFYDVEYLVRKWSRLAKVVSVHPEAHDHQTSLLFQKVARA